MKIILAILAHSFACYTVRSNLITDEAALWPKHTVPFEYGDSLGEEQKLQMKNIFYMFHAKTCIRFVARHKNETDYLLIEIGEWKTLLPSIGRRGGRQVLTFTAKDFERKRVILRDLMRTLGFYYEIQRPDRFMFVDVQTKNILTKDWSKFRQINAADINLLDESYDYNSATHFAPEEYTSANAPAFTILAPNQNVGQDNGLSEIDIRRVNKAYKCEFSISDNSLCPDKWTSGQDGRCYYFSFLDPASKSVQGPGRRACEKILGIPLVMSELSIPSRSFVLDMMRHSRVDSVWVIGTSPSRDLSAERDNSCSTLDLMNNVRSLDNAVPCEGTFRNFTCQRTAANECWYVRDSTFEMYPDCLKDWRG